MADVYENGIYRNYTPEEVSAMEAEQERLEREYWTQTPYDDLVNAEIRRRYSASQEFAISRQRDRKPEEWNAYDSYCEECKNFVKQKLTEYGMEAKINA